jgi:hypothetical protein
MPQLVSLSWVPLGPACGSKSREVLDGEISEPGKNRGHTPAHRNFQTPAAFYHGKDRRDLRSRLRAGWAACGRHPVGG